MILHLLKLVWHRKRANALVMTEIFFSFLIVFAVVTLAVSLISRWGAPLGFDWHDVWVMSVDAPLTEEHSGTRTQGPSQAERTADQKKSDQAELLLRELRRFPQIEAVGADAMPPYADRVWESVLTVNGRSVTVTADQATAGFARVMRVKTVRGRWFLPEDEARDHVSVVIDTDAARALFGDADPIGQKIPIDSRFARDVREFRVVGVMPPYRQSGEFSSNGGNMVFFGASQHLNAPATDQVVFRVRPGTPGSFEAELNGRLRSVAPDVTFRIRRMSQLRDEALRLRVVPVAALAVVALFLISMVALGLTGVLWQTVTRRMREIGLRRALGATAHGVRAQVLGEVALLSTLAVLLGVIVVVQLPLLGFLRVVSAGEFTSGFGSAIAVIYAITLLCGAYPSWLASTIDPAEALRYE